VTANLRIIAYYCYSFYDLIQASSVNKVPTILNRIFMYYGM